MVTHAAVDDEVERITERDEHVDEHRRYLECIVIDHSHLDRVLND